MSDTTTETEAVPMLEVTYVLGDIVCRYEAAAETVSGMAAAAHRFYEPERHASTFEEFKALSQEALDFAHFVVEQTMLDEHPGWCDPTISFTTLLERFRAQREA